MWDALLFGVGAFWLATAHPGEENGWVPWMVGSMFSSGGLYALLGRRRVVFDPVSRRWSERWGIPFLEFSDSGSFDQVRKIRLEQSRESDWVDSDEAMSEAEQKKAEFLNHSGVFYIWVIGRSGMKVLAESTYYPEKAEAVIRQLQEMLDVPVEKVTTAYTKHRH